MQILIKNTVSCFFDSRAKVRDPSQATTCVASRKTTWGIARRHELIAQPAVLAYQTYEAGFDLALSHGCSFAVVSLARAHAHTHIPRKLGVSGVARPLYTLCLFFLYIIFNSSTKRRKRFCYKTLAALNFVFLSSTLQRRIFNTSTGYLQHDSARSTVAPHTAFRRAPAQYPAIRAPVPAGC